MTDNRTIHRFGPFEFDSRTGELTKHGIRKHLPKQPATVLETLLRADGQLVTRITVARSLWPNHDAIDHQDRLNHVVKRLREALGDSADQPAYVATEPGRGYRFVAPVTTVDNPAVDRARTPTGTRRKPSRQNLLWYGAALVALTAAAVMVVGWNKQPADDRPTIAVSELNATSDLPSVGDWLHGFTVDLTAALAASGALDVRTDGGGVRYQLEGALVSQHPPHRLALRLVDQDKGSIVWSAVFDQTSSIDAFRAHTIDSALAAILRRMLPPETDRVAGLQTYSRHVDALYQQASTLLNDGRTDAALLVYQDLLEIEPSHALAHANVARALLHRGWFTPSPSRDLIPLARLSALRSLELDDSLAQPYLVLANIKGFYDWQWGDAETFYAKALERNPNYAPTYLDYSGYLMVLGRTEEALEMVRTADALDPLSAGTQGLVGTLLHYLGDFDRAHVHFDTALAIQPDNALHTAIKACTYIFQGRYDEAERFLDDASRRLPDDDGLQIVRAYLLSVVGELEEARSHLLELNSDQLSSMSKMMSVSVLVAMNDLDAAISHLEDAYNERLIAMPFSRIHPAYEGIRNDPRYLAIMQRMGLQPALAQAAGSR